MKYFWDKQQIIKELWHIIHLLDTFPNNEKYKKVLQKYGDIILLSNIFNEYEKKIYIDLISSMLYSNDDYLEETIYSLDQPDIRCYIEEKLFECAQIEYVFNEFNIDDETLNKLNALCERIKDEEDISIYEFINVYNKKISNDNIIKIYLHFLKKLDNKEKYKIFSKLIDNGNRIQFEDASLDNNVSGTCHNITKKIKYIIIYNSFDLEKLLILGHEMEHVYDFKNNNSNNYKEINSMLTELYLIDYLVDTNVINEKEYICFMLYLLSSWLPFANDLNEMKTNFEKKYFDSKYYNNSDIYDVIIDSNDTKYFTSSLLALNLYLNFSRKNAYEFIENNLKNNKLDSVIPNINEVIENLNIFIDELFERYYEIVEIEKQKKRSRRR